MQNGLSSITRISDVDGTIKLCAILNASSEVLKVLDKHVVDIS